MSSPVGKQSHLRYPLTALFSSPGNVRVLRVLADGTAWSTSQIAKSAGLTPQGTRLVLEPLVRQRIVISKGSGRVQLFELATGHPLSKTIREAFETERDTWIGLLDGLRSLLVAHEGVRAAWLYGSVARGEDTPASDVDLALLVESSDVADRVRNDMMALEDQKHLHISIAALTPAELALVTDDDAWWADVVRDCRILKGSAPESEFKRASASVAA